jgi:transcriptional regulator with XRE-family HTH domain
LREASQRTGVDKSKLSKIERGITHPHDITLSRLARGYGVPVEELLGDPAVAASEPSAPVGTLEWAVAAPEDEYARWIERTSSMELHAMFANLRANLDDPRRPLILDRAQAAIDEFFRRNPIEKVILRRETSKGEAAASHREVPEGQESRGA